MLSHDFDLTSTHLQAPSSRESIVAFCAQPGYYTEMRVPARLRTEYEQSVKTLKPLKARLAWTDGMIKPTDDQATRVTRPDVLACQPGKHVTISGGDLRNLLTHLFSVDELAVFCARYFPAACDQFSADMTQAQQVQALVDYCVQHYRTTDLSELIILARPDTFRPKVVETVRKARQLFTRSERLRQDVIRLVAPMVIVGLAGAFPGVVTFLVNVAMIVIAVALVGLGLFAVWWWCRPRPPQAAPLEARPPGNSLLKRIEQRQQPTDSTPHDE